MSKRRFLVVTVIIDSAKRAIPIECIARLFEVQDKNNTVIDYFCGEEKERIWVKESFESIMAGDHTVVL